MSDLISRQAAIELIERMKPYHQEADDIAEMIANMPSAQPTKSSCWGCNCPKMERLKEQKTFSEMVHLHDAERIIYE